MLLCLCLIFAFACSSTLCLKCVISIHLSFVSNLFNIFSFSSFSVSYFFRYFHCNWVIIIISLGVVVVRFLWLFICFVVGIAVYYLLCFFHFFLPHIVTKLFCLYFVVFIGLFTSHFYAIQLLQSLLPFVIFLPIL